MPDVECRVGKGSADVDGGARNMMEGSKDRRRSADVGSGAPTWVQERLSSAAAIHAKCRRKGREVNVLE